MKICLIALLFSAHAGAVALRRETNVPLKRCNAAEVTGRFPVTSAYLKRILDRLIASNPDTFHGDLAPDLFCVGASDNFGGLRAWADAENRSFQIEPGLIELAQSEAQIAAVMAHELAHVTMRNALCDGYPALQDRDTLVARKCEHDRLVEERSALKGTSFTPAQMEAISNRIETLQDQISDALHAQMGAEAAANWIEVEADEVGRQFFLAAGFSELEVAWRHEQLVLWPPFGVSTSAPLQSSQRRADALRACGLQTGSAAPTRGTHRYAESCWSLWNLLINPARPLASASGGVVSLSGSPTLAEAKAEIAIEAAKPGPVKPKS